MKHLFATLLCIAGLSLAQASDFKASLDDILLLANRNVSDQTVMVFIQTRGIDFIPGAEDIDKLLEAGISEEVIRFLLEQSSTAAVPDNAYRQLPTYIAPYPAYYYYPYYSNPRIYHGFSGLLHVSYIHHRAERHSVRRHTDPRHPVHKRHQSPAPPLHHDSNQIVHSRVHNPKPHTSINPGHKSAKNSHHGKKHSQKHGGKHKGSLSRGHTRTGGGHHSRSH